MANQSTRMFQADWQKNVNAQATSGLSQSDYCRAHQLNIRYISFWKGKLRKATKLAAQSDVNPIDLIPIVMKNASNKKPHRLRLPKAHESFRRTLRFTLRWNFDYRTEEYYCPSLAN